MRNASQMLGCYLAVLANDATELSQVELPIDKKLIASQLGMTPETLSRAIATLKEHGVGMRGNTVNIRDRAALEAYCRPESLIDALEKGLKVVLD